MFKVCILAAGVGSRNNLYHNLHKALLPLKDRAVIDDIISNIPNVEIVVACGAYKEQLKSYLDTIYGPRFTYVDVDNYQDVGSGPGYSLLQCKDHLQCPFIFLTTDTVFDFKLQEPLYDWIAISSRKTNGRYCIVDYNEFEFSYYGNKIFAGFAGIYDYKRFFQALESAPLINQQKELITALKSINPKHILIETYDTGNNEAYKKTLQLFGEPINSKYEQITYIDKINKKVVKFHENPCKITSLVYKFNQYSLCPKATRINENMLSYDFIEGNLLSENYSVNIFNQFIDNIFNTRIDNVNLQNDVVSMYQNKTFERAKEILPEVSNINGITVGPITQILDKINWATFDSYLPCIFHGDLQPENVIVSNGKLVFLDPRDRFGENPDYGDLYYELGKVYHALFVNGTNIKKDLFTVVINGNEAEINWQIPANLLQLKSILKQKCLTHNIQWEKVVLSGLLQYINICSLYTNTKYSQFLYLLGKLKLTQFINGELDDIFN